MSSARASKFDLQDHGVAVRRGSCMSLITTRHPKTGRDLVYAGFNTGGPFLVVQVDLATGKCRQFNGPAGCSAPWGMIATDDGRVLVSSTGGGICLLDPDRNTFKLVGQCQTWFWHIARGGDGKYYFAGNGPNHLHRFDLVTGQIENLGSVSPTQAYLRSLVPGNDGYIYGTIGSTKAQIIAYHMVTGKVTELLPKSEEKFVPWPGLSGSPDGTVYAMGGSGTKYRLENGRAKKHPKVDDKSCYGLRTAARLLVRYVDPDAICIRKGKKNRYIPLQYEAPGCSIFHLAQGPNDTVYGSTIMPLYIFRHTPRTSKTECLGRGAPDNGEAYSFGHVDGQLYYATYPTAFLMQHDPAKPWELTRIQKPNPHQEACVCGMSKMGEQPLWDSNPKLLGKLGVGHCRPRAMFVDSKKRVWVGSIPEYGKCNGGLACYDTVRRSWQNNPVVLHNLSITALTADDEAKIIYGGTDIGLGSGTPSVEKEGRLFAWDAAKQKLLWDLVPVPGASGITNLIHHQGKLYGTTHQSHFFIYDIASKKIEQVITGTFAPARQESMALGPDGNLYGITWMSLFRWRPDGKLQELWRVKSRSAKPYGGSLFHRGAVIVGERCYFSSGARVMSVRLPLETGKKK